MDKIKIGLIGASWFADLWFLPVLVRHPRAEVTAICSKNGTNARAMADKYGIPNVYASASEMMDRAGLDGICIITPNDRHYPLTMAALEKGLHVLCEKPLALNGGQAAEMNRLAAERGLVNRVNFSVREHPGIQYMRAAVKRGQIGRFTEGRFEYTGDYGLSGPPGWRGSVREGGAGGVLQDLGSHLVDLADYVLGDAIASVQASMRCLEDGRAVPFAERANRDQAADSVYFQADFASGGHGVFQSSWIKPQGKNGQTISVELHGTEGSLMLHMTGFGARLRFGKPGVAWEDISPPGMLVHDESAVPGEDRFRPYRESDKNEAWRWADAVAAAKSGQGNPPGDDSPPDFAAADRAQHVIDAVLKSSDTGAKAFVVAE